MSVHRLHRITGFILLAFIALHLGSHLFALGGPDAHNAALKTVQLLYRNALIEPILIAAVAVQIVLGVRLAIRSWRVRGKSGWAKAQLASGLFLAYFMLNHTGAALYTRIVGGLDTNFQWVSGPLLHPQMQAFFYPYYGLAVMAISIHAAAVLHYAGKHIAARVLPMAGAALVLIYWASFGGWLFAVSPDPAYRAYYDQMIAMIF